MQNKKQVELRNDYGSQGDRLPIRKGDQITIVEGRVTREVVVTSVTPNFMAIKDATES